MAKATVCKTGKAWVRVPSVPPMERKQGMSNMMQDEFEKFVHDTICEHPDWIAGTIRAMNYGALARVEKEVDRRAEADTALCLVLSTEQGKKAFAGLPEEQKKRVAASVETGSFGGTPWSKSLKE